MIKSSHPLDVYFHMTNHYRKLNDVKPRVNSGRSKKTKINGDRTTEMKKNKNVPNMNTKRDTQRNSRPKTRRNVSDMPQQMKNKPRGASNKSNGSSVARKPRARSTRSGSQSSRNSSNQAAGDTRNTSADRSTTHGVESIVKDSVNEHEYLQFALRITEDIIKNDLYSCVEMKRVFNSHIEANRGRLEINKMKEQVRNLAKELNVKYEEPEVYTLVPDEACKATISCTKGEESKPCELIYVSEGMKNFDEGVNSEASKSRCKSALCELDEKESQSNKKETEILSIPAVKSTEKCCKSMNTLTEVTCDACTNTKIPELQNVLISVGPIIPDEIIKIDGHVQAMCDKVEPVSKKSQACCKSLEKIWVVDVATSMSLQENVQSVLENVVDKHEDISEEAPDSDFLKQSQDTSEEMPKFVSKSSDSDSSINSAEEFKKSIEQEETPRVLPTQEEGVNSVRKDLNQYKMKSDVVRLPSYTKPLEVGQHYFITTLMNYSKMVTEDVQQAQKSQPSEPAQPQPSRQANRVHPNCTCPCCMKSEPPNPTIWDENDIHDVYDRRGDSDKSKEPKTDIKNEEEPENLPFILPILPKVIENNDFNKLKEDPKMKKEPKKGTNCKCNRKNCFKFCTIKDEYSFYLPDMLARFFPSEATQTTSSDLLLIDTISKEQSKRSKTQQEVINDEPFKLEKTTDQNKIENEIYKSDESRELLNLIDNVETLIGTDIIGSKEFSKENVSNEKLESEEFSAEESMDERAKHLLAEISPLSSSYPGTENIPEKVESDQYMEPPVKPKIPKGRTSFSIDLREPSEMMKSISEMVRVVQEEKNQKASNKSDNTKDVINERTDDFIKEKIDNLINDKKDDLLNEKNGDLINEKIDDLINEKKDDLLNKKIDDLINEKKGDLINEKKGDLVNEKKDYLTNKQSESEESIPIIIPEKEEELFKKDVSGTNMLYDLPSKDTDDLREDGNPSDIEVFMNQLDYKPTTVAKTSSFERSVKKTINEGEMFRHPETRRIGFETHSGIDLTKTTITEEDHHLTIKSSDTESGNEKSE